MNNRATFGVEYQNNVKTALSLATEDRFTYFEADIPFTVMSIYAFDEYQISKDLLISFGARHDRNSKDESSATVPRAALIVHPFRSSSVKLLYGEAFRAPGFVERDLAVPFLLAPNPNLRPERVRSYEAVWEQRVGQSYFATISLYRNDLFDMIRTLSTEVLPTKYDNIGRARATGVEVEAWARWSNGAGGFA
ncbi:MAG: TonB-dependent receptor, partial [Candidatus Poribacteria bacterium]|nr:TonB-dependent receptor [Candidatus Poribacteria bacterium]